MSNSLFINPNFQGMYTVEPAHSNTPLATCKTQEEAIAWAKKNHPERPCHVARVRHLNDKKIPDHWRKVH